MTYTETEAKLISWKWGRGCLPAGLSACHAHLMFQSLSSLMDVERDFSAAASRACLRPGSGPRCWCALELSTCRGTWLVLLQPSQFCQHLIFYIKSLCIPISFTEFCPFLIIWWSRFLSWAISQAKGSSTYRFPSLVFLSTPIRKAHSFLSVWKPLVPALTIQNLSLAYCFYNTRSKCICILVFILYINNTEILVLIQVLYCNNKIRHFLQFVLRCYSIWDKN